MKLMALKMHKLDYKFRHIFGFNLLLRVADVFSSLISCPLLCQSKNSLLRHKNYVFDHQS